MKAAPGCAALRAPMFIGQFDESLVELSTILRRVTLTNEALRALTRTKAFVGEWYFALVFFNAFCVIMILN